MDSFARGLWLRLEHDPQEDHHDQLCRPMARAQRSGKEPVTSSAPNFNPTFSYNSEGECHEVWLLDASTFANQLRALDQEGCAGVLIDHLGTEDPHVWSILNHHSDYEPKVLQELETVEPKKTIAQIGDGDFLNADLSSKPGRRKLWVNVTGSDDGGRGRAGR